MIAAAEHPLGDPLAALAAPQGPLRPGYDHAVAAAADHGAWTAWTFAGFARALIALGRHAEAERLVDWLDALPLPEDGPTGAVARFAHRETMRLRLALRAPAEPAGGVA